MSVHIAERISFTTDLWTGCHKVKHYHTLPSPDNMQFHHQCITTKEVSVAQCREFGKWNWRGVKQMGITDYIYGATTDNAWNIRNAIVDIMELYHLSCIGHTLQLSVDKSFWFTSVVWLLGRVKKPVERFKRSMKETYALCDKQILLDIPQHELIQQCDTRWNFTLYMLQRVKEQQPALFSVLYESKDSRSFSFPWWVWMKSFGGFCGCPGAIWRGH